MPTNKTSVQEPYQRLEAAIEEMLFELVDLSARDGTDASDEEMKNIRQSMTLKYWTVIREIKRLQVSGKNLKRLRKSSTGFPARVVGNRSVVSKRR